MRIYKRGKYWWASFPWQGQTIRKSTRCTTRPAALLTAQRWERERADPDHAAAASATFGGAVTAFLADLERSDKPQATRQFYRRKAGTLTRILGAGRLLSEVNAQLVDRYIATREQEPVAFDAAGKPTRFVTANTIHKELVTLRQVLKRAKRRGEFRRDVSEVLPVGFSPRYVPRNVSLTFAEAERLLATLKPARAAAVAFALATTARRSEVFRAWRLDANGTIVDLRGTKTAGSYRTVTVPGFAVPLIDFAKVHGDGKEGLLFRPWPNAIRGLRAACRRAKCPRVTWNDLRRTLSTWLVEGGVSDTVIAKMLGHVDTTMLHRVYGKPRQDAMGALLTEQSKAIPALTIGGKDGAEAPVSGGAGEARGAPREGGGGAGRPSDGEARLEAEGGLCDLPPQGEVAVRPAYAPADEQEPPQPIATSEQGFYPWENSVNGVGPVGIEPTTKGLKVQSCKVCRGHGGWYENGVPLRCWSCLGNGLPDGKATNVRGVNIPNDDCGGRESCEYCRAHWDDDDVRAVDAQQTSERGHRTGDEGRYEGGAKPSGAPQYPLRSELADRPQDGPSPAGASEAPAPTSGGDSSLASWKAEGAGSPEEPPVHCIACSVGDACPFHTSAWTGRREPGSAGAAEAEEPPFSSVSRPGPQRPLAGEHFDRERWDAQLLGACRAALEALRCI